MAAITNTAAPVRGVAQPRRRRRPKNLTAIGARLLAALRDFREGASWEPGRDWLTRVSDPGEPQEPR
jgi:hypothetical protein